MILSKILIIRRMSYLFYLCFLSSIYFWTLVGGRVHPVPDGTTTTLSATTTTVQSDGTTSFVSSSDFPSDDENDRISIPALPLQFRADITIVAHLVDKVRVYWKVYTVKTVTIIIF